MKKKKYQLYAVGNALVDVVVQASDDFIKRHKINRGVMTLTDYDQQKQLLSEFPLQRRLQQSGGSAANTAVAFAELGGSSFYACLVGDDELGDFYLKDLASAGVHTLSEHALHTKGKTGTCLVIVSPDAERSMCTYLGVTQDASPQLLNQEALSSSEWLYMEGYLLTGAHGLETLKEAHTIARAEGIHTALSLSDPHVVQSMGDKFHKLLEPGVDLLFSNREEARIFSGSEDMEETTKCLERVAKQYVITLGNRGAFLYDGTSYHHIPATLTQVIDTNGAGDMFAAGFLYGLTHGRSFLESGQIAVHASSKIVSKLGPRLDRTQISSLKEQIFSELNP